MATANYTATPTAWTRVAQGAALVELRKQCKRVFVTTSVTQPAPEFDAYHTVSALDCRTFSYGGTHGVYVKSDTTDGDVNVIVTSDNLA